MSDWTATVEAEAEDGSAEVWTISFRRMTARTMAEARDAVKDLTDGVEILTATMPLITRSVECDGNTVGDPADIPLDVLTRIPQFHPNLAAPAPTAGE